MAWDESAYRAFFRAINEVEPYGFQVQVARRMIEGVNVVLTAPTGSGKTATVLTPFLWPDWTDRPSRLIYALPLRSLAQSIFRNACKTVKRSGRAADFKVTLQTGEQPDDQFFDHGQIIVTTYDQVLSGLLAGPYGLSPKLHNVNAAAIAGTLVVFDEFHLMEPQRAFLTGAAGLYLFRELAQSVWMTATATSPLVEVLGESIGAESIGLTKDELDCLPSVSTVSRTVVWESRPLLDGVGSQQIRDRVIVIANTVERAQAVFRELTRANPDVPAVLLHSRFFKSHRREKEQQLQALFGRGARGPALLVATQVIEAGIDISCDHLHTELAPMNALIQRAGRCARYAGEIGVVHVHPLPEVPRAWLPYGTTARPDPTLSRTGDLLSQMSSEGRLLTAEIAAEWVEAVHGANDRDALAIGWTSRFDDIRKVIHQTAVLRRPPGVAHFIREPDADDRRVIICTGEKLPERPALRESLSLSRWQIAKLLESAAEGCAWVWEEGDEPGWRPLLSKDQLAGAFTVALSPALVRYSAELGLELGEPGTEESPDREEPPRPGHRPLRAESWETHSRLVMNEALRRLERDRASARLAPAFERRYRLSALALRDCVRACAMLHDLGKLQRGWQEWAEEAQRRRDPDYQHVEPLAHTDFDPDSPIDRQIARELGTRRPPHSAASAYLGIPALPSLLGSASPERRGQAASACAAAVLSHHGGWLPEREDLGVQALSPEAGRVLAATFGPDAAHGMGNLLKRLDRRRTLGQLLDYTMGPDTIQEWWPLVAYLTRTLRLADHHATREGGRDE